MLGKQTNAAGRVPSDAIGGAWTMKDLSQGIRHGVHTIGRQLQHVETRAWIRWLRCDTNELKERFPYPGKVN